MNNEIHTSPSTLDTIKLAEHYLIKFGYAKSTMVHYQRTWKQLKQFIHKNLIHEHASVRTLSPKLLSNCGMCSKCSSDMSWSEEQAHRSLRILITLQETGVFRPYRKRVDPPPILPIFQHSLDDYLAFCRDKLDLQRSTVICKERILKIFMSFLSDDTDASPTNISQVHIADYIKTRSARLKTCTLSGEVGVIRGYLRFLCMQGQLDSSITLHMQTIRFSKEHHLPPVWPTETVERLLNAIDRQTSTGKRDYAMLMIAARLGIRAGDIINLKLDNIDWSACCFKFTQKKTQRPLSLPLFQDVAEAIIDYLKCARPESTRRELFLKIRAPQGPLTSTGTIYSIIKGAMEKSNIELDIGIPRGAHALRHTLATNLLKHGQPMESISSVLGHSSIESTRVYTHVDIEALRSVALEICDA